MKTEIAAEVGMHRFERSGLGKAPFRFVGVNENFITHPDGSTQAGGTCDFCGTGIRFECHCESADGKHFKVGSDCIAKVGDDGLLKAYKTSPAFRAKAQAARDKKAAVVAEELQQIIARLMSSLSDQPHPRGFTNRTTGAPLTLLDDVLWSFHHCGRSGQAALLKWLKTKELKLNHVA